ncbi:MAG: hypothetical protein V5A43_05585 [Haloarculaceae archaeon]
MLSAGGVALAAGVAGCELRRVTETPDPGDRTFTFEIENRIEEQDLESYSPIEGTPPAVVTVIVEATAPDGTETMLVDETIDLPPSSDRTIPNAFTTTADGTKYRVTVKLGEFQRYESFGHDPEFHSDGRRFTPGGTGHPAGTTFLVTIVETEPKGQYFKPKISLEVAGE